MGLIAKESYCDWLNPTTENAMFSRIWEALVDFCFSHQKTSDTSVAKLYFSLLVIPSVCLFFFSSTLFH